jgi:P pilus assembly chaperone PapD
MTRWFRWIPITQVMKGAGMRVARKAFALVVVTLGLVALAAGPARGQVAAETILREGHGLAPVQNGSDSPISVTVEIRHGTVLEGHLELGDPVNAIVTPRAFRLEPGGRQAVRVLLRETVPPGTVLRLVTTMTPVPETSSPQEQVVTRLVLATRFITKALVR